MTVESHSVLQILKVSNFHSSRIRECILQFASEELLRPKGSYLLEVLVAVNVFLIVGVLQLVCFYVLPERLDDGGSGLGVDPQQPG